ncbi:MAG: DUF1501 domain-containing protein, partial [Gemmataceae bacterium]|nr:DUF1501 domain-containing protein [Gemmataceae bacterium]
LASLEAAASPPARRTHHEPKAKACIFVFLIGGTSQIEMFDPKPALDKLDGKPIPESFRKGVRLGQTTFKAPLLRSKTGFRRYGRCGMELSELLPNLGKHADDLCLVRSMHCEAFDHAPGELECTTGKDRPGRPTMGAWLSYGLGCETKNLPAYAVLMNGRSPKSRSLCWGSGFLPAEHGGVLFRTKGSPILDLGLPDGVTPEAHRAHLDAIAELNALRAARTGDPATAARTASYELAFRMQAAAPGLLDLKGESKATLASYGPSGFGRSLLLARRMVEKGVRFVTVTHHEWDHHDGIATALPSACKAMDGPVAALLSDLKARGLLSSTLVVGGTEFGRTAITQGSAKKPGRDHHPHAFSVFLAGGGVAGGRVVGKTDDLAWRVEEDPVHTHDFHATLLHLFGLDHTRLTFPHQGLDARLTDVGGKVVKKMLSSPP